MIKVEVDWNRDSDYSDAEEDVTAAIRRASVVTVEYGRDQSTALAPTLSGRGSFTLDNWDGKYSSRNTGSPLYGLIKPARPVRITRTTGAVGTTALYPSETLFPSETFYPAGAEATYTLFVGHSDDTPLNPNPNDKSVTLSLVDSLADFRGLTISTNLYSGLRTGTAIGLVLDACGWPADKRDLDAGATFIPWWWEDNTDALEALEKILRSEGPPALLTISETGAVVFRDRHHRLIDAPSITSQSFWSATGEVADLFSDTLSDTFGMTGQIEPVIHREGFSLDEAWRNIINTGTVSVDVRIPAVLQTVWESESTFALNAGETRQVTVTSTDPFYGAVTPVVATDFTAITGTVTASLSRTSGASTTITLSSAAGGSVSGLKLRAYPVPVSYTVQVSATDTASVADYGARSFPHDLPWCNAYDAKAILDYTVKQRAQPVPIVNCEFVVATIQERCDAILTRNLSDRVTVVEGETFLNNDFYVESIRHTFTGEHDHTVAVGAEGIPNNMVDPATILILGSSVPGHRLSEGVLAP